MSDHASVATRWAEYQPAATARPRPASLEIRPARPAECDSIAAIEASRDGVEASPAQRRCLAQVIDPETLLLVAIVDGNVVGYARAGFLHRPADASPDHVPDGWYLLGVAMVDAWRRCGIGRALTERRLDWIGERADVVYYFANARNRASLDLHRAMGFVELTRHFSVPGVAFAGGRGVLCRLELRAR